MKDKYIAKPPGALGYRLHQDGAYWPGLGLDTSRILTAILFLDDSPAECGAIECAPGQHSHLLTMPEVVADLNEASVAPMVAIEARAGDVLFLHALTPHRSDRNRSQSMRRTLLFTYGVDSSRDLYETYALARTA